MCFSSKPPAQQPVPTPPVTELPKPLASPEAAGTSGTTASVRRANSRSALRLPTGVDAPQSGLNIPT